MSTPEQPNGPSASAPDATPGIPSNGWLSAQSIFAEPDPRQRKRAAGAMMATIGLHGLFLLLAFVAFTYTPEEVTETAPPPLIHMVYLQQPGPGGGGGGSPAPAPPKPVTIPKSNPPTPAPVVPVPPPPKPPPPAPTFSAPIMTPDATLAQATGTSSVSLAAFGGGGRGSGLGSGTGSGVGQGTGGGFGGDAYRLGSGIQNPQLVREFKPSYTSEAMRAKIQGSVELEAVLLANGTIGDVRVKRSLDRVTGLDQEAVKAAKLWIFQPARDREGRPVPVLITMILDFHLH